MKKRNDSTAEIPAITGSVIKKIRKMTKKETKQNGFTALCFILDSGVRLFAEDVAGEFENDAFWVTAETRGK